MSSYTLWVSLAVAILFFWAVGAYNRLVRLRAAVNRAFAALDEQLMRQVVWVQGCLPAALRDTMMTAPAALPDDASAAWLRLNAAGDQFASALAQARSAASSAKPAMASLVMAHEALRSAWIGVIADAIAPDAVPSAERLQERWMRLLHQAMPLRTVYNDAANAYNQAIGQFPAVVVAKLFGFRPAGTLTRLSDGR